jgi:hypothetical protein
MTLSRESDSRPRRSQLADREPPRGGHRLRVHPDVAAKFIVRAMVDGATIPNPCELDGAFQLALQWAYSRMGGDVRHF